MSIKIAFDISPLNSGHAFRGIGIYTQKLAEALKKQASKEDVQIDFINVIDGRWPKDKYNLIHYPYFDFFFLTLPLKKVIKTVVTIHDTIPLIFPKHYPPGMKGKIKFLIQKLSLQGVSAVITDSEASKKDIAKYLDVPREKIDVVYPAPGGKFQKLEIDDWQTEILKKYHLPERFVLYVGDVNWNKNLLGLAEACKKIKTPLVIVGKKATQEDFDKTHPENQPLVKFLEKYGQDKDILRLGFVEDEDLVKIYNLAAVYSQPSFYEGFGMAVLEAMSCGCPVVCSRNSSLVEIGGSAAVFFDPDDTDDMAEKIKGVIEDEKISRRLAHDGLIQAKKFSWGKCAQETINVYKKIL